MYVSGWARAARGVLALLQSTPELTGPLSRDPSLPTRFARCTGLRRLRRSLALARAPGYGATPPSRSWRRGRGRPLAPGEARRGGQLRAFDARAGAGGERLRSSPAVHPWFLILRGYTLRANTPRAAWLAWRSRGRRRVAVVVVGRAVFCTPRSGHAIGVSWARAGTGGRRPVHRQSITCPRPWSTAVHAVFCSWRRGRAYIHGGFLSR